MTEPTTSTNPRSDRQSFLDYYREILTEVRDLPAEDQIYALHFFLYDALRRLEDLEDDNRDLEGEVARLDAPPSDRERAAQAHAHELVDELERTRKALDHSEAHAARLCCDSPARRTSIRSCSRSAMSSAASVRTCSDGVPAGASPRRCPLRESLSRRWPGPRPPRRPPRNHLLAPLSAGSESHRSMPAGKELELARFRVSVAGPLSSSTRLLPPLIDP